MSTDCYRTLFNSAWLEQKSNLFGSYEGAKWGKHAVKGVAIVSLVTSKYGDLVPWAKATCGCYKIFYILLMSLTVMNA